MHVVWQAAKAVQVGTDVVQVLVGMKRSRPDTGASKVNEYAVALERTGVRRCPCAIGLGHTILIQFLEFTAHGQYDAAVLARDVSNDE